MATSNQQLDFVTLDVFTQTPYKGNPLAVVLIPAGRDVPTDTLQAIAREFNYSETVFIYLNDQTAESPEWRIRIFLTTQEITFAGHPTIGVAIHALKNLVSRLSGTEKKTKGTFVCNAGPIEVEYDASTGVAEASIPHNVRLHAQHSVTVEDVFTLQPALRAAGVQPLALQTVSPVKGMNFVCVELPDLEALAKVGTSGVKASPTLDDGWNEGFSGSLFYVKTGEDEFRTRMIEGLLEDPATGSASCGLAAWTCLKEKVDRDIKITQGVEMGRKSEIGVKVTLSDDKASISRIDLKGSAVQIMQGRLTY